MVRGRDDFPKRRRGHGPGQRLRRHELLHGKGDGLHDVEVIDVAPTVTLSKAVDKTTLAEPGGTFNYTLTVTNTGPEPVEIVEFTDSQLPGGVPYDPIDLLMPGVPLVINYPVSHAQPGTYANTAAITVMDNELGQASASAASTVTVTDVKPTVTLDKAVVTDPPWMDEPGGAFTFSLTITNTSVEPVTITALTDTNSLARRHHRSHRHDHARARSSPRRTR